MVLFNAKVIAITQEAIDTKQIILKVEKGLDHFYPGQFCYLQFKDDFSYTRPYSISSDYEKYQKENIIEFNIKKMNNGFVSVFVNEQLKLGDDIKISQPKGNLSIKDKNVENILFIAGGSGITMVKTFIEYFVKEKHKNFYLVYGVKFDNQIIFENYFKKIKDKEFQYQILVSDQSDTKYSKGFINDQILDPIIKTNIYDSAFIVGPEPMIEKMISILKTLNFKGKIYVE